MRKCWQIESDGCLRACVAMVLDRDIREVPYYDAELASFWRNWMGYFMAEDVTFCLYPNPNRAEYPEGPWIAAVEGARDGSMRHSIVMDGRRLYHDPIRQHPPRRQAPHKVFFGIELTQNA